MKGVITKTVTLLLLVSILLVCVLNTIEARRGGKLRRVLRRVVGKRAAKIAAKQAPAAGAPAAVIQKCKSEGDPHLTTFEGVYYDHYGKGDYILAATQDGNFIAHSRTGQWGRVSVNTAIAVKVNNLNTVEYNVEDDKFYVDGKEMNIAVGEKVTLGGEASATRNSATRLTVVAKNQATLIATWFRNQGWKQSMGSFGHISLIIEAPSTVKFTEGMCVNKNDVNKSANGLLHNHINRQIVRSRKPKKATPKQLEKAKETCKKVGIQKAVHARAFRACVTDQIQSGTKIGKTIAKVIKKVEKAADKKQKKLEKKIKKKLAKRVARRATKKVSQKKVSQKKQQKKSSVKKSQKKQKKQKKAVKRAERKQKRRVRKAKRVLKRSQKKKRRAAIKKAKKAANQAKKAVLKKKQSVIRAQKKSIRRLRRTARKLKRKARKARKLVKNLLRRAEKTGKKRDIRAYKLARKNARRARKSARRACKKINKNAKKINKLVKKVKNDAKKAAKTAQKLTLKRALKPTPRRLKLAINRAAAVVVKKKTVKRIKRMLRRVLRLKRKLGRKFDPKKHLPKRILELVQKLKLAGKCPIRNKNTVTTLGKKVVKQLVSVSKCNSF